MAKRKKTDNESLLEELRGHLAIDKSDLDTEIQQQPRLFEKASEAAVLANAHRDFCKEEINRVDADLAAKHRRRIEKSGARATDASVSSAVAADPKHHKAVDAHIEAKKQADLLQGLKESFHQRSYMLRDLAGLFVANYFERDAISTDKAVNKDFRAEKNRERMAEARANLGSKKSTRKRVKE